MTVSTTARVPTTSGSRYLQQLCKHWSHNLEVEFSAESGTVTFPKEGRSGSWPDKGVLTMTAQKDTLDCTLSASVAEQLDTLKGVTERHLDRFAFREAPLTFDWVDD